MSAPNATLRFLVNECTASSDLVTTLRAHEHDVVLARERYKGKPDSFLLEVGRVERRIILTDDKGFGKMIIHERRPFFCVVKFGSEMSDREKVRKVQWMAERYGTEVNREWLLIFDSHALPRMAHPARERLLAIERELRSKGLPVPTMAGTRFQEGTGIPHTDTERKGEGK